MKYSFKWTFLLILGWQTTVCLAQDQYAENKANTEFLRFIEGEAEWQGSLQTAINSYENSDGVTLDLVAAIHIADKDYYAALNSYFRTKDHVLYELVAEPDNRPDPQSTVAAASGLSFLQIALARFLNVDFQLQWIDYSPGNFIHADMSPIQLRTIMTQKNETFFSMFLAIALAQLASSQNIQDGNSTSLLQVIAALNSENRRESLKYLLARELARADSLVLDPDVEAQLTLLGDRNRIALARLEESLRDPAIRSISLFFGAAHMPGLERAITESMGFRKVDTSWFTAWAVP